MNDDFLDKIGIRPYLTRFIQFFLGLDGLLHGLEVISAYYEEAWTTLVLTSFHAIIFLIAAYFVGHDHSHHTNHTHNNKGEEVGDGENKSSLWKNIIFGIIIFLALIFFTPLGELLHIVEDGHDH